MILGPVDDFHEITSRQIGGTGYTCVADGCQDWERELADLAFLCRETAQREFEQCGLQWCGSPEVIGQTLDIPSPDYTMHISLMRQRVYGACAIDDRQELIAMIQAMARVPYDRYGAGRIWGNGGEPSILQVRSSKTPRIVLLDTERPRMHFIVAWYFFHEKAVAA